MPRRAASSRIRRAGSFARSQSAGDGGGGSSGGRGAFGAGTSGAALGVGGGRGRVRVMRMTGDVDGRDGAVREGRSGKAAMKASVIVDGVAVRRRGWGWDGWGRVQVVEEGSWRGWEEEGLSKLGEGVRAEAALERKLLSEWFRGGTGTVPC